MRPDDDAGSGPDDPRPGGPARATRLEAVLMATQLCGLAALPVAFSRQLHALGVPPAGTAVMVVAGIAASGQVLARSAAGRSTTAPFMVLLVIGLVCCAAFAAQPQAATP